jgi:hypothetical protein
MIHDLDIAWKDLVTQSGISADDNTNTNIIVDDIFNWVLSFDSALQYMECQLQICKAYCLTLSLKKSRFFLKSFEFVGIDVSPDGNRPAMSKHQLLDHWPKPEFVCNVTSFIGFVHSYSAFIPYFKVCAKPLREIMQLNTCWVSEIYGPSQPQPHFMNYTSAFFAILAFVVSITKSSLSCGPTFCPKVLATWFANLTMTTHPCNWLANICLAIVLVS